MKRIRLLLISVLFVLLFIPNAIKAEEKEIRLYLFHQSTCPHCKEEIKFLDSIKDDYPNVDMVFYEIDTNEMNYNFYKKVKQAIDLKANGVPFTIIGTDFYIGFGDDIGKNIIKSVDKFIKSDNYIDIISIIKNEEEVSLSVDEKTSTILIDGKKVVEDSSKKETSEPIPILGEVNPKTVSLTLVSIIMGFVDGFNPCAMWVLLFLITMLIRMENKKRMWILGITFLVTSAFIYLLYMLGIDLMLSFMAKNIVQVLIALVALIGGYINIRSYVRARGKDEGCEVVNDNKRKSIISRIKGIVTEKSFALALIGIIILAVSVNLVEVACSAGLPATFIQILRINELEPVGFGFYMFLYILLFLIDDIVIFVIAMITLNIKGISSKYGKYSHLIGGIIMIIIAILMIFKPEWLMFNFG